jgi:hypothetical protein
MKFTTNRRWWTRGTAGNRSSPDGLWLPLLGLGGLVAMLIFSAWWFEPTAESLAACTASPAPSSAADFQQLPAVHVRLRANVAGRLAAIVFNGRPVRDAADLREQIMAFRGPATNSTVEAELDCDANLRYEDTQRLIAAISSYPAADRRTSVPLVDRVTFLPRRRS